MHLWTWSAVLPRTLQVLLVIAKPDTAGAHSMSQARARRLTQLERQVHAHALPMWAEVDAAMEGLLTAARAYVDAVRHG